MRESLRHNVPITGMIIPMREYDEMDKKKTIESAHELFSRIVQDHFVSHPVGLHDMLRHRSAQTYERRSESNTLSAVLGIIIDGEVRLTAEIQHTLNSWDSHMASNKKEFTLATNTVSLFNGQRTDTMPLIRTCRSNQALAVEGIADATGDDVTAIGAGKFTDDPTSPHLRITAFGPHKTVEVMNRLVVRPVMTDKLD